MVNIVIYQKIKEKRVRVKTIRVDDTLRINQLRKIALLVCGYNENVMDGRFDISGEFNFLGRVTQSFKYNDQSSLSDYFPYISLIAYSLDVNPNAPQCMPQWIYPYKVLTIKADQITKEFVMQAALLEQYSSGTDIDQKLVELARATAGRVNAPLTCNIDTLKRAINSLPDKSDIALQVYPIPNTALATNCKYTLIAEKTSLSQHNFNINIHGITDADSKIALLNALPIVGKSALTVREEFPVVDATLNDLQKVSQFVPRDQQFCLRVKELPGLQFKVHQRWSSTASITQLSNTNASPLQKNERATISLTLEHIYEDGRFRQVNRDVISADHLLAALKMLREHTIVDKLQLCDVAVPYTHMQRLLELLTPQHDLFIEGQVERQELGFFNCTAIVGVANPKCTFRLINAEFEGYHNSDIAQFISYLPVDMEKIIEIGSVDIIRSSIKLFIEIFKHPGITSLKINQCKISGNLEQALLPLLQLNYKITELHVAEHVLPATIKKILERNKQLPDIIAKTKSLYSMIAEVALILTENEPETIEKCHPDILSRIAQSVKLYQYCVDSISYFELWESNNVSENREDDTVFRHDVLKTYRVSLDTIFQRCVELARLRQRIFPPDQIIYMVNNLIAMLDYSRAIEAELRQFSSESAWCSNKYRILQMLSTSWIINGCELYSIRILIRRNNIKESMYIANILCQLDFNEGCRMLQYCVESYLAELLRVRHDKFILTADELNTCMDFVLRYALPPESILKYVHIILCYHILPIVREKYKKSILDKLEFTNQTKPDFFQTKLDEAQYNAEKLINVMSLLLKFNSSIFASSGDVRTLPDYLKTVAYLLKRVNNIPSEFRVQQQENEKQSLADQERRRSSFLASQDLPFLAVDPRMEAEESQKNGGIVLKNFANSQSAMFHLANPKNVERVVLKHTVQTNRTSPASSASKDSNSTALIPPKFN